MDLRRADRDRNYQHLGWAVWDYAAGFDVTETANGSRQIDPQVSAALGLTPWHETEPVRTPPSFTGPLEVQMGPRDATLRSALRAIDASGDLVVTTFARRIRSKYSASDEEGLLHSVAFDGEVPRVACLAHRDGPFRSLGTYRLLLSQRKQQTRSAFRRHPEGHRDSRRSGEDCDRGRYRSPRSG